MCVCVCVCVSMGHAPDANKFYSILFYNISFRLNFFVNFAKNNTLLNGLRTHTYIHYVRTCLLFIVTTISIEMQNQHLTFIEKLCFLIMSSNAKSV